MVRFETSMGDFVVELDTEKAPETCENFLQYVRDGFYDGTIFHRVIDGFMVQGGGFTETMKQKETREPVQNEADNGLKNEEYTLAMARTQDPHSATAQFFINVKNNAFLNHSGKSVSGWGYAVFGKVTMGQSTIDAIKAVPTGSYGPFENVPLVPVVINKAVVMD
ncbi:peptidylprolyl isomerase [Oleidesulfovibrio sp.]|uniref:peptidylprolyl isomerase n=1 Tax=Oleidesulfovibrio sp. TaxID=2909707 RepID=UPI003A8ABA3A